MKADVLKSLWYVILFCIEPISGLQEGSKEAGFLKEKARKDNILTRWGKERERKG